MWPIAVLACLMAPGSPEFAGRRVHGVRPIACIHACGFQMRRLLRRVASGAAFERPVVVRQHKMRRRAISQPDAKFAGFGALIQMHGVHYCGLAYRVLIARCSLRNRVCFEE